MMPAMAQKRHIYVEQRLKDMAEYAETSPLNTVEINDTKIGLLPPEFAISTQKEAFPEASVLKLGLVYPMPKSLYAILRQRLISFM